jgi:lysophospholipase L1-like esterase
MTATLVIAVSATFAASANESPFRFARWEKEVQAIERRLAADPPKKGGVVFAGSSSIRLWDVPKSFPDLPAANVGFGGSEVRDCTHFAPRLVFPHEPAAVVFYAGDNDLANRRTPEQVRDDFRAFAKAVHQRLPKCRVLFVSVKPSPKRWALFVEQQRANRMVADLCAADDRLRYVDVVTPMLGNDGQPTPDLFVKDELHLSAKGYEVWVKVMGEHLRK